MRKGFYFLGLLRCSALLVVSMAWATNLLASGTLTVASAPAYSATRPLIWVKAADREDILAKVAEQPWAETYVQDLMARTAGALNAYEDDPDAYLRALPVNWSLAEPQFYTTEGKTRGPFESKLNTALDCAVLYYLSGNARYAALAAGVLHNSVKSLLNTPYSDSVVNGGWTIHADLLKEARVVGTQMPIIYDFLHGYLDNHLVWDVAASGSVAFSKDDAQAVFERYIWLCNNHGGGSSNWSSLMRICLFNCIMALDDQSTRDEKLDDCLTHNYSRQTSLAKDISDMDGSSPYAIYHESLNYAGAIPSFNVPILSIIERYDPSLKVYANYAILPESAHRINQLVYPGGEWKIQYGDGHRAAGSADPDPTQSVPSYSQAELIYSTAKRLGITELADFNAGLIAEGLATGVYRRPALKSYSSLGGHNEHLQLLWAEPTIAAEPVAIELPRTDTVPFAGIALQRNLSSNGDPDYGLMGFVGGAAHIHSHASGMNMELYGLGEVLGAKTTGRSDYARNFASANTVVVNGYSRGIGGWKDIAINTVQVEAMEPAARQPAVSSNLSFTCSSFVDDKGDGAEATQQRTMAIIRTSPTTGFYVDIFRSDSALDSEYHDYIYHNIGDSLTLTDTDGTPLALNSEPNRFTNDDDVAYWGVRGSPGWGYFTETMASSTVSDSVRAQFVTRPTRSPEPIFMDLHIPGSAEREYATALAPAVGESSEPYDDASLPTLVVRKNGEAWNQPFAVVFEPHHGKADGSVVNVSTLEQDGVVVGMQVESRVGGSNITHYILSNPDEGQSFSDPVLGLSFRGRFAIVSDYGDGAGELYLGDGSFLEYGEVRVRSQGDINTQASVLFEAEGALVVTANDPVEASRSGGLKFYLQSAKSYQADDDDKTYWWDAADGGTRMDELDTDFFGNHFLLNGHGFSTKNTAATHSFDGTLVSDGENIRVYSKTYQLAGLNVMSNTCEFVMRRSDMDVNIGALSLDGELHVRANSSERNMALRIDKLNGSGELTFGRDNEEGPSVWELDIGESFFSGTINVRKGRLQLSSALTLTNATLNIMAEDPSAIILSKNSSFLALNYNGTFLEPGTYTAAQLETLYGNSGKFSGEASLTVLTRNPVQKPIDLYNAWIEGYTSLGELTKWHDDYEPDGLDNLIEYALGGNPTQNDAESLLATSVEDGWLHLVYKRRKDAAVRGLTYTFFSGTNLVDDSITNVLPRFGTPTNFGDGFETMTHRIPTTSDPQGYMRLEVELSE